VIANRVLHPDLYFRLSVVTIALPPLRERGDDILLLIHHFAAKYAQEFGKPTLQFSDELLHVLRDCYKWPGNVRELENVVHSLFVMAEGQRLDVTDLPALMRFAAPRSLDLTRTLAAVESEYIHNVLASVGGNKSKAARILGIDRKTLRDKLQGPEREPEA
jgi:DNA-binding NtrC family response regulator